MQEKLAAKEKVLYKLRNELKYYKSLVFSVPVEQSYLCKNVTDYSSLKYLTKKPDNTRTQQFLADYNNDIQHSLAQTLSKVSHYTKRRKERNYHLAKKNLTTEEPMKKLKKTQTKKSKKTKSSKRSE